MRSRLPSSGHRAIHGYPATWLASLVFCATPTCTHADQANAQFRVSAQVLETVVLERVTGADSLTITDQDVLAGYKEAILSYRIRTNSPRGTLLRFTPRLGLTRSITIRGLSQPLILSDQEVEVMQRAISDLALTVRFELDDRAVPGVYEFPLIVSATVLPQPFEP